MQAVGLKTHIWNNNLKSVLLLAGFPVLLVGMLWCVQLGAMGAGYLPSTGDVAQDFARSTAMLVGTGPLALLGAGGWYGVAYASNNAIVARATGAKKVTRVEQPELYNLLENLAISRGLRTPQLRIVDSPVLNAYASGLSEKQHTVTVTRGLVEALDRDEMECVLGHELTHIINRDVRLMVIAGVFAGIISLIAEAFLRSLRHAGRRSSKNSKGGALLLLIAVGAVLIGYMLAVVIRASISQKREYIADAGAVELTKNPDAMIRALQKISGRADLEAPEEIQAMFFENRPHTFFGRLLPTHPPIEKRIEALVRYAGGRVEAPVGFPGASRAVS